MMPYARVIRKHLDRVRELGPTLIAPSHGPAHEPPAWILDAYADWLSEQPKNLVVLPHVSMHGSTAAMVNELIAALAARRIPVQPFDLAHLKLDRLAAALVDAATVVVASPSVWNAMHPLAVMAAYLVNGLKPKLKHAAVIGSYGWGSKAFEQFGSMIADLKAEMLPPILVKGVMKDDTRRQLHDLADQIAARHDALGLV
jgi:flavorubredoxin